MLALRLEHRFDKREILGLYLNLAAYGNQVVGAGKAARVYFGAEPPMLTAAQAAFLAGLPQRPSGYNPFRSRDQAIARQRTVLRRMEAAGALSRDQAREARDERLRFSRNSSPFLAPHFVEMVIAAAGAEAGENLPPRIETTLDAGLQSDVVGIIRSHRQALERHGAANVAVVVLDNASGEWLAWEGSGDYADAEHGGAINGPLSPRQPGSALKPFTYALAFESGFTPASVLADVPSHFPTAEAGVLYSPRNYDGRYRGPLLARRALAGSENVPAVVLASELGVPALQRFLLRAGLSTLDRTPSYYGLGLTLGNAEVRLDELVAAYSTFARGGDWLEPSWSSSPDTAATAHREPHAPVAHLAAHRVLGHRRALRRQCARVHLRAGREPGVPVSRGCQDRNVAGVSRQLDDRIHARRDRRRVGRELRSHAAQVLDRRHRCGADLPRRHARRHTPAARRRRIRRARHRARRPTVSSSAKCARCPACRRIRGARRGSANGCPPADDPPCSWHHQSDEGLLVVWPPQYRQWARQNGLLADSRPRLGAGELAAASASRSDSSVAAGPAPARGPLEIVNPPAGATYLIDPTLRREFQTLPLRVVAATPGTIEWQVAGRVVGSSSSEVALMWPLAPGVHRITARDERGRVAESSVVVK